MIAYSNHFQDKRIVEILVTGVKCERLIPEVSYLISPYINISLIHIVNRNSIAFFSKVNQNSNFWVFFLKIDLEMTNVLAFLFYSAINKIKNKSSAKIYPLPT